MADRKNTQNIKAAVKSSKNKSLFETIKEQINDLKQCTLLFDDLMKCAQSVQKNIEKMEDVFNLAMKLQDMKNISKDLDMMVKEKEKIYQEKDVSGIGKMTLPVMAATTANEELSEVIERINLQLYIESGPIPKKLASHTQMHIPP
ncbi:unnamed protein product [Onchocerca ochengi]|uniref:Uncharacterized protein n=1 Tax=Onchocerca ochengi TaxID=42157 RepID=A0A182DY92_ONCOC|nr:unnamed protein product [Onchocerca ochengi]VDK62546.1 unnamed protein product [Onchocerca ochengi]